MSSQRFARVSRWLRRDFGGLGVALRVVEMKV
jgi:hypothetical protein